MAATPKETLEKINQTAKAWATLRPDKTFAGLTLARFQDKIKPSLLARDTVNALENQLIAAQNQRGDADKVSLAACQIVVNAVKGDPDEGEDGELYEALGYVRKSERSSGLHRAKVAAKA